ncbi:PERQ amino acid-rich with GYF domain-containing protein 2 [Paragonimus heterotremus]|uniref:PERQ amino acid-rich with GYF domain-containing protein 2 n=1 Tax=Paragonimus heterotremus TaxID=100268 RepID=A0A8J4WK46_9TREM|nr:PERQ amino acid-rich with GYF domain-containing protein 2 [Paragonimus heterotremus]
MATQPETLNFGPQWIRKLSDCTFSAQLNSSQRQINMSSETIAVLSDEDATRKQLFPRTESINKTINLRTEGLGIDTFEAIDWDPASTFVPGSMGNGDHFVRRSQGNADSVIKSTLSASSQYCDRSTGHNGGLDSEQSNVVKNTADSAFIWHKTTEPSMTGHSWQQRPVSNASNSFNIPADVSGWKTSCSPIPSSMDSDAPKVTARNPTDSSTTFPHPSSLDSSFTSLVSKDLPNTQISESSDAYFGIHSPEKRLSSTSISAALWDQNQHLWSKPVPHQLHGVEPLNSLTATTLPPCPSQNASCNVPEVDKPEGLFAQLRSFDASDQNNPFDPPTSRSFSYTLTDEVRRLHQPDGADRPDEHLWFYEDPQGRTQGSFSDAQMNDWLLAGIYFTPNLCIRRKCDTAFSTLADYTRLFGRIPFTSGPRVSPIRGTITSSLLNSVNNSSAHQLATAEPHSVSAEHMCTTGLGSASTGLHSTLTTSLDNAQTVPGATVRPAVPASPSNRVSTSAFQTDPPCSQVSTLAKPLAGVTVTGSSYSESDPQLMNNLGHSVVSPSTFMSLASDFTSTALTPGFLAALAQYLNVQPLTVGHQPVSPMQQLAETAQLAAQLAAMASAHQTPMQPAQALALAELVRSQASNPHWFTQAKKDGVSDFSYDRCSDTNDRRIDGSSNEDLVGPSTVNAHKSTSGLGEESQPRWPPSFGNTGGSAARVSPRVGEGRFSTKSHDDTHPGDSFTLNSDRPRDSQSRANPIGFPARQQVNSQAKAPGQPLFNSRPGSGKITIPNGLGTFDPGSSSADSESAGHSSNSFLWQRTVIDGTEDDAVGNVGNSLESRGSRVHPSHNRHIQPTTGQWVNKVKQTPPKSTTQGARTAPDNTPIAKAVRAVSSNTATGIKGSGSQANHGKANTDQASKSTSNRISTTGNARSPMKSTANSQSTIKEAKSSAIMVDQSSSPIRSDSDHTEEQELARLTQWCQTRLSSMSMREKVDIPTVVELLATLDAPYEVERMVQTFLGESSRTSLFVKDFLDQRRPFWQLHRERRDNECLAKPGISQSSTSNGSTPRSADKKKRSSGGGGGGQDCGNRTSSNRQNSTGNGCTDGGGGWVKVTSHSAHTEHAHDNQVIYFFDQLCCWA